MADMNDYTTSFVVDKTPEEVYSAILNIAGWWSGEVRGNSDEVGNEFTYEVPGAHWSKQKATTLVPGKKIVWHVEDSNLSFTKAKNEWTNTDITFEIGEKDGQTEVRFSHLGLVPSFECYGDCSNAWDALVCGNLKRLIESNEPQPSPW